MNVDEAARWTEDRCLYLTTALRDDRGKWNCWNASGFAVLADGELFWVTAAHVLDELAEMRQKRQLTEIRLRPGGKDVIDIPIPSSLLTPITVPSIASARMATRNHRHEKQILSRADVGVLHIPSPFREYLFERGAVAFDSKTCCPTEDLMRSWMRLDSAAIIMVGVPKAAIHVDETGLMTATAARLTIKPRFKRTKRPFMYFDPHWDRTKFDRSVAGMSGAPIVLQGLDQPMLGGIQSTNMVRGDRYPKWLKVIEIEFLIALLPEIARLTRLIPATERAAQDAIDAGGVLLRSTL